MFASRLSSNISNRLQYQHTITLNFIINMKTIMILKDNNKNKNQKEKETRIIEPGLRVEMYYIHKMSPDIPRSNAIFQKCSF